MKKNFIALVSGIVLALATAPSAFAQTPDGETPAEETLCDPLKADGVTKGLYGLCVAFCEAQDHASLSSPITEAELEALEAATPSGRILGNYNKKKTEADPPMPCIKVEPCPCWTEDEFLKASQEAFDSPINFNICADNFRGRGTLHYISSSNPDDDDLVFAFESSGRPFCLYQKDGMRDGSGTFRNISVTPEELGACRDRVIARQDEFGLVPDVSEGSGSFRFCWTGGREDDLN
jgi:hypothetical protein